MLEISKRSISVGVGVWKLRIDELPSSQSLLSSFRLPVMLMVFIFSVFINSNNKDYFVFYTYSRTQLYFNYTVGIQLHVSALYAGQLQVVI